jgi:hypothetical protein
MNVNEVPAFDKSDNATGCCPRFHPEAWENLSLRFEEKLFARATTVGLFHIPLNMGSVFTKSWGAIEKAAAVPGGFVVLSRDLSGWRAEHLFAVDREVPGLEMVRLTGEFVTKVFEGPFSHAPRWCEAMTKEVADKGRKLADLYFFYTTCPRCSKVYGKNYVVGVARVE